MRLQWARNPASSMLPLLSIGVTIIENISGLGGWAKVMVCDRRLTRMLQLGVVRPARTIHDMAEWGRLAEDIGFSLVATGDSQTMWMDPYIALSQVAAATSKVKLCPLVTVPRTRHPSVSACSIGTLQKL